MAAGSVRRWLVKSTLALGVGAALLLGIAGRWDWGRAWCWLALMAASQVASGLMVFQKQPDLLAERSRVHPGTKKWDRLLAPMVGRLGPMASIVVAGLDQRWGWSPEVPWWVSGVGLGVCACAIVLVLWAMVTNRFFSGTVRIQTDRGHQVVDSGPYSWIRHPGYTGGLLFMLGTPFALGSLWTLAPEAGTALALVVRTALEDRTLRAELPGYADYAARVRCRLAPGVW